MKHKELTFESKEQSQLQTSYDGITFFTPIRVEYKGHVGYVKSKDEVAEMMDRLHQIVEEKEFAEMRTNMKSSHEISPDTLAYIEEKLRRISESPYGVGTRNPYYLGPPKIVPFIYDSGTDPSEAKKAIDKMIWNLSGKWVTLTKGWWLFKKLFAVWSIDMNKEIKPMTFCKRYDFDPLRIRPKKELTFAK